MLGKALWAAGGSWMMWKMVKENNTKKETAEHQLKIEKKTTYTENLKYVD